MSLIEYLLYIGLFVRKKIHKETKPDGVCITRIFRQIIINAKIEICLNTNTVYTLQNYYTVLNRFFFNSKTD